MSRFIDLKSFKVDSITGNMVISGEVLRNLTSLQDLRSTPVRRRKSRSRIRFPTTSRRQDHMLNLHRPGIVGSVETPPGDEPDPPHVVVHSSFRKGVQSVN